jgi:hypothetical protein
MDELLRGKHGLHCRTRAGPLPGPPASNVPLPATSTANYKQTPYPRDTMRSVRALGEPEEVVG